MSNNKISNEQLLAENRSFSKINNTLNYNIEVQIMLLNELKILVWDEKYSELRAGVVASPEFKKLTSRANL